MKIGLSQRVFYHKGRAYDAIEHGWYHYLKAHTLSFIPNNLEQDWHQWSEDLDAFIITGGDDSALRRSTELKLATTMMAKHKPILGVCHGCFLLTEVLGGSITEVADHRDVDHTIDYFGETFTVNSFHSLAIGRVQKTATILATDGQGHCESWIDNNIAGVVWHPERMTQPFLPVEISNLLGI